MGENQLDIMIDKWHAYQLDERKHKTCKMQRKKHDMIAHPWNQRARQVAVKREIEASSKN